MTDALFQVDFALSVRPRSGKRDGMAIRRLAVFLTFTIVTSLSARDRARDFGISFGRFEPGKRNAISDVAGVRVGHVSLIEGQGELVPGRGPVRTGVTVIVPAPDSTWDRKLPAGSFVLNGNGEAMGLMWIVESGILETPIALTNTLSVGNVQKGLLDVILKKHPLIGIDDDTVTPVVMECDDSSLNDIRGQHVKPEHVVKAVETASDKVAEGSVGAGVGMISYDLKGGIGTSSRRVPIDGKTYTLGVLVNTNHGDRNELRMGDTSVGKFLKVPPPGKKQEGSIVVVIATDAPLDSRQLSRLAKRSFLGISRMGATAFHGSGDLAIAFSTANRIPHYPKHATYKMTVLSDFFINDLFEAVTDIAEEALANALVAATTVTGRDGYTAYGLPHDQLRQILRKSK